MKEEFIESVWVSEKPNAYTFALPNDLLQLIALETSTGQRIYDYEHIGYSINVSETPLVVLYSRSLYTTGKADFDVSEAIALYLAYDVCERIDENTNRRQQLYQEFMNFFSMVKTTDSRKGGPTSYGPINVYGPSLTDPNRPNEIIDSRVR